MSLQLLAGVAFSVAAAASLHASVLKVSPAGPGDFRQIQDAVAAAADGDIILVEPGDYGPFTVTGKSLDIQADGAPCSVTGLIAVTSLAADQTVVLRGLDSNAALAAEATEAVHLENCAGAVRIEGGNYRASTETALLAAPAGVTIVACASVSLHGSRIVGGKNLQTSSLPAGTGLVCSGASHVSLWNCSCGGEGTYAANGSPAPGARIDGGTLFAAGTNFGGGTQYSQLAVCKPGADGLDLVGGAQAQFLDDAFVAGAGSPPLPPLCTSGGPPGTALSVDQASGSVAEFLPGQAREFTVTSPVREGQTATFTFHGAPLASTALLFAFSTQDVWLPGLQGTLLVGSPFVALPLGATDALGDLSFSATIPELGPGVSGVSVSCQALFVLPSVSKALGPLSPLLLLDSGY